MDLELDGLDWFLKGPFFGMIPPPRTDQQEITEYLNENNLTIINFDVVSNLRKLLNAKEMEWKERERQLEVRENRLVDREKKLEDREKKLEESERKFECTQEEIQKERRKMDMRKDLCILNQAKLVDSISNVASLTEFMVPSGSELSKCVLIGKLDLDKFNQHVNNTIEKLKHSRDSSVASTSTNSSVTWGDEKHASTESMSPRNKAKKRKFENERLLALSPQSSSSKKSYTTPVSSTLLTDLECVWGVQKCSCEIQEK